VAHHGEGVAARRLRYALTALAVLLGVAFIAGTLVLTDTSNATFNGLYTQIYLGTGAVIRARQPFNPGLHFASQRQRIDASLASRAARYPGGEGGQPRHRGLRPARGPGRQADRRGGQRPAHSRRGLDERRGPQPAAAAARWASPADEFPGGDRQALCRRRPLPGRRQGRGAHPAAACHLHHHRHRHLGQGDAMGSGQSAVRAISLIRWLETSTVRPSGSALPASPSPTHWRPGHYGPTERPAIAPPWPPAPEWTCSCAPARTPVKATRPELRCRTGSPAAPSTGRCSPPRFSGSCRCEQAFAARPRPLWPNFARARRSRLRRTAGARLSSGSRC
jgi:hypothetical protein